MKLTDELLTQLVNEEIQRVDEKKTLPIGFQYKDKAGKTVKLKNVAAKISHLATKTRAAAMKKAIPKATPWNELFGAAGDASQLSVEDIEQAFADPASPEYKAAMAMKKYADGKSNYDGKIKDIFQSVLSKTIPKLAAGTELSKQDLANIEDIYDISRQELAVIAPEIVQVQTDMDAKAAGSSYPIGGVDTTKNRIFKAGRVDPSTASVYKLFLEGLNIPQRIKKLSTFAKLANQAAGGDEASIGTLQNMSVDEIVAGSMVLKNFTSVMQEISQMEAGKFFEAFLSIFLSGAVVGGKGGAIDNLAGKTGEIMLSAKLYNKMTGVKQALGSNDAKSIGIINSTKGGNIVWYIIGIRTLPTNASPEATSAVGIHVIGVGEEEQSKGWPLYDADSGGLGYAAAKDGELLIGAAVPNKQADESIPIFDVSNGVQSIDTVLNRAFKEVNNKTLTAINQIYQRLNRMEKNTTDFTGKKADKNTSGNLADEIIKDHSGIKADFQTLLDEWLGQGTKTLQENEKLTQEVLDKLIERVILDRQ